MQSHVFDALQDLSETLRHKLEATLHQSSVQQAQATAKVGGPRCPSYSNPV